MIGYVHTLASIKERALLLALVEFAPNIEPSTASLAIMLGTSEREVRRLLRSSESKGVLSVELRTGRRSRYTLADPGHRVPPDNTSPRTPCPPTSDTLSSPPRTPCPPKQTSKAGKEADKRETRARAAPDSAADRKRKRSKPVETSLPRNWEPSDAHRAYATKHGIVLQFELDGFRGWANDRTQVSWDGAFTTRLANRAKWNAEAKANGSTNRKGPVVQRGVAAGVNMDGDSSWIKDEPEQQAIGGAR